MADLKVDFDQLEASRSALHRLHGEFDRATAIVDADDEIWGDGHVSDAMHNFAGNWKIHKGKLLDKMGECEELTAKCIETFEKADGKLAAGVQVHHSGSGPVSAR